MPRASHPMPTHPCLVPHALTSHTLCPFDSCPFASCLAPRAPWTLGPLAHALHHTPPAPPTPPCAPCALQIRAQMAACGCPLLGDHLYTVLATRWGVRPDARAHDCASASARDDDEASGSLGAAQSGRMGSAAAATQAVSAPAQLLAPAAPAAVVEGVPEPPCEAQGQLQGQEAPWWAGIKEEALNPVCLQVGGRREEEKEERGGCAP